MVCAAVRVGLRSVDESCLHGIEVDVRDDGVPVGVRLDLTGEEASADAKFCSIDNPECEACQ